MILFDMSVWVDHLRNGNRSLQAALESGEVIMHPFIIGEPACWNLRNRAEILRLLSDLPMMSCADNGEVLERIGSKHLYGMGIGWIDAHLIVAARQYEVPLATLDKPLRKAATTLGLFLA
jgi:predicted nucleic acid-binding protein